jgi:hypothetical protein
MTRFSQRNLVFSWRVMSLLLALLLAVSPIPAVVAGAATAQTSPLAPTNCALMNGASSIRHVIVVQFDNVHFLRDNPNVPSDLEQMPHLLNFIEGNGTLLANHHTPLIAHTATDLLTALTGVYGDRHGQPVSNSYRYYAPNGTTNTGVSFAYWTAPLFDPANPQPPIDTLPTMLTAAGQNAPAPWVPFTRAGCNVGSVSTANTILENTAIDIPTVFGANSPEAAEVQSNPGQAFADFVGIGIHCAAGNALCSAANNGKPDLLPDEPGGYTGYNALFGHKYVAPQISPNGPLTDLNGNIIQDGAGHIGFPGFDGMSATVSLSYVAAMQEHGVPVTYAYISDAHDQHPNGPAYGPGSAGYVQALAAYDDAFARFFARLAQDGINQSNTLFVFNADEGDHFVGGAPSPANCDGVNTPCTYNQIGELNANLAGLLATQQGVTTPFKVHSDAAPTVYITGNPAPDNQTVTRPFERAAAQLTAQNPMTGKTDTLTRYMADPVEMKLLHMITADPARTPTFTLFANPDYFVYAGAANCTSPCVTQEPGFAWNHGDVSPDINTTWLGMVGPGIRHLGVDDTIWSDHADIRPTIMMALSLRDDYAHDGRALFEVFNAAAVPQTVRAHRATLLRLAQVYKAINAPVGSFGLATLKLSTQALASGSASDDSTYTAIEQRLSDLTTQRNTLAGQMIATLEAATFTGQPLNETQAKALIDQGHALLDKVDAEQ